MGKWGHDGPLDGGVGTELGLWRSCAGLRARNPEVLLHGKLANHNLQSGETEWKIVEGDAFRDQQHLFTRPLRGENRCHDLRAQLKRKNESSRLLVRHSLFYFSILFLTHGST
ncbi:MAG: hypothetical protein ACPGWR_33455 [Ardenticatenaceae bacterium]